MAALLPSNETLWSASPINERSRYDETSLFRDQQFYPYSVAEKKIKFTHLLTQKVFLYVSMYLNEKMGHGGLPFAFAFPAWII